MKRDNWSLLMGIGAWVIPLITINVGGQLLGLVAGVILAVSARSFGKDATQISGKIGRILGTGLLIVVVIMIVFALVRPLIGKFLVKQY